jgi:hypothetical protein
VNPQAFWAGSKVRIFFKACPVALASLTWSNIFHLMSLDFFLVGQLEVHHAEYHSIAPRPDRLQLRLMPFQSLAENGCIFRSIVDYKVRSAYGEFPLSEGRLSVHVQWRYSTCLEASINAVALAWEILFGRTLWRRHFRLRLSINTMFWLFVSENWCKSVCHIRLI